MMSARAVIGANFGDEGKGAVVDYLANKGGDVVVRFNGGAQAGHTVVTPDGKRHVFSHFSSGTMLGLPTFFSQHTIVNPILCLKEFDELIDIGVVPRLYVHEDAMVTTLWDMNRNQNVEAARGKYEAHGSCGVGIFETVKRNKLFSLYMKDLLRPNLEQVLGRCSGKMMATPVEMENMLDACRRFRDLVTVVRPKGIRRWSDPIFEGAQGLLLCQSNMDMYPHLTPSRCGLNNVRELAYEGGFTLDAAYYVSRTYMTRHGAGPMPQEDTSMRFEDATNKRNRWQGPLRFGHLNCDALLRRVHADYEHPVIVLTHCDQLAPPRDVGDLFSYGPTRNDFQAHIGQVRTA